MTDTVTIRALTYSDLPQVLAVERRAFTSPWSLSMFVLELSKPSGICLAAIQGGEIVGYVICARYDEAYHVMTLATAPEHRREGIASALLDAVIERAGADANYTLEARVSNLGAIALYERYGFRGVGTRPRYYADNGEDAIIMWRALGTPWEPR
ncbi:MAG TPA: ribosomal protein S18-alanine N-acetyltransferase [Solirubrobacteraceae bacterium]|jgi:ribosomal-protein-alanine N-acetyltransferase|nr:ribosomal protein S18-alanine N-acetyltransferase [Solirubrobacteraceae bacterium]